jgi:hypothetical protein
MFVTLDANQAKVEAARTEFAEFISKDLNVRAQGRKEIASGDGDFTRISLAEGRFIDLAIHKDTFLDDAAIMTDVQAATPVAWKSRYAPTAGFTTASVYGGPARHLYATQDQAQFIQTFPVEVPEVMVPRMSLTQDIEALGIRTAGLLRQAEALKIHQEALLVNVMLQQPLGTDLAASVTAYRNGANPYLNKTIYIADPGVQNGTYETSNIIDASAYGGLEVATIDALITQGILTKRQVRTIHMPVTGMPWRKLVRQATIVSGSTVTAPASVNPGLQALPAAEWQKMFSMNFDDIMNGGLTIQLMGHTFKLKANNALPAGLCIVTTDQPAAEIFNVTDFSVSGDLEDPRQPYFAGHYEKRQWGIAVPDPWYRNFYILDCGTTSNL